MATKKRKQSRAIVEVKDIESVTPEQIEKLTEIETQKRKAITEFINKHFKKEIDYGTIEMRGKTGKQYKSKPCLFKPGSEKWCSLFKVRPTFKIDKETRESFKNIPGLVAYICYLKNSKGEIIGEGRGAAYLGERQGWTPNNVIKIAQKRAQIDAVLRTGSLSDFFTQDLEDVIEGEYETVSEEPFLDRNRKPVQGNFSELKKMNAGEKISKEEKEELKELIKKEGFKTLKDWEERYGKKIEELTKAEADRLIEVYRLRVRTKKSPSKIKNFKCEVCGKEVTPDEETYSKREFGRVLCRSCQKDLRKWEENLGKKK